MNHKKCIYEIKTNIVINNNEKYMLQAFTEPREIKVTVAIPHRCIKDEIIQTTEKVLFDYIINT